MQDASKPHTPNTPTPLPHHIATLTYRPTQGRATREQRTKCFRPRGLLRQVIQDSGRFKYLMIEYRMNSVASPEERGGRARVGVPETPKNRGVQVQVKPPDKGSNK